jgi:parallel beta-helix repeat protein
MSRICIKFGRCASLLAALIGGSKVTAMSLKTILLILLVGLFVAAFGLLGRDAPRAQDCSVTVQPGQTIRSAIAQASVGAVICLSAGTWEENLLINKGLTLRGAGPDQTLIQGVKVDEPIIRIEDFSDAMVTIEGLRMTQHHLKGWGRGMDIFSTTGTVVIRNVQIVKTNRDGLQVMGRVSVNLIDSQISDSGDTYPHLLFDEGGIRVGGSAQLTITNSRVLDNKSYGLVAYDSATVKLTDSRVSGNGGEKFVLRGVGLIAADRATVELENSLISANEFHGLSVEDLAVVRVRRSTIEENGLGFFRCSRVNTICNGVVIQGQAVVELFDSQILNNLDWGLAAVRKECGYEEDQFTGQVFFYGQNTITGNNKSGNHTAQGNPGKHPFTDLPPGNVCLP